MKSKTEERETRTLSSLRSHRPTSSQLVLSHNK